MLLCNCSPVALCAAYPHPLHLQYIVAFREDDDEDGGRRGKEAEGLPGSPGGATQLPEGLGASPLVPPGASGGGASMLGAGGSALNMAERLPSGTQGGAYLPTDDFEIWFSRLIKSVRRSRVTDVRRMLEEGEAGPCAAKPGECVWYKEGHPRDPQGRKERGNGCRPAWPLGLPLYPCMP